MTDTPICKHGYFGGCQDCEAATGDYAAVVAERDAALAQARAALATINVIRNSIIGSQSINWSEHIYPLVAALNAAGFPGESYPVARENFGTLAERAFAAEAELAQARERIAAAQPKPRDESVPAPEDMPGQWGWEDEGTLANDEGDTQLSLADADTLRVTTLNDHDVCCESDIPFAAIEMLTGREARARADERERIAAAIERDHQPGTYPHEMAKAIRANKTPGGHPL